jgi:hypothetical protein
MMLGSAAVANIRRIQRYLEAKNEVETQQKQAGSEQNCIPEITAPSLFDSVWAFLMQMLRPLPLLGPVSSG